MSFDLFGGSNPSTKQTAQNSQVTGSGSGILGIGSGTTFNLGSTTIGKGVKGSKKATGNASPIGNSATIPNPANNVLTITTADVNAIDLASHALDANTVLSAAAIKSVGDNATNLGISALAAQNHVFDTASLLFGKALDTINSTTALNLAANNQVANEALTISANTIPQSPQAASEILAAAQTPLAGSPAPVDNGTPDNTPHSSSTLLWVSLILGAVVAAKQFKLI